VEEGREGRKGGREACIFTDRRKGRGGEESDVGAG